MLLNMNFVIYEYLDLWWIIYGNFHSNLCNGIERIKKTNIDGMEGDMMHTLDSRKSRSKFSPISRRHALNTRGMFLLSNVVTVTWKQNPMQ